MKVLVLDGNENQAVACVRSLARAGHRPRVGADAAWSKAGLSRFAAARFRYPSPRRDHDRFVAAIVAELARTGPALVLPLTEATTLPLSLHRSRILEAGGRLVLPGHDVLLRAFDKEYVRGLADSLGIVTPRTMTWSDEEPPGAADLPLCFPLVLKPRTSEEVRGGAAHATGAPVYAHDAADLARAYRTIRARCGQVLLQEFVEGVGSGYFALMQHGDLRAEFAHRRIRDVRPTGSGSALRESIAIAPELRESSLRLLRALDWHGVAMVEYRVRADGVPVLLEVNGRFWNSLALAVHAGVDFPALVARIAAGEVLDGAPAYRAGLRCRWLLGDARHLVAVMKGPPPGYPGAFPSRLATLAAVLRPVPGTRHDNFEPGDPLPEIGDWLDFLGRRVPRALHRTRSARAGG